MFVFGKKEKYLTSVFSLIKIKRTIIQWFRLVAVLLRLFIDFFLQLYDLHLFVAFIYRLVKYITTRREFK